jgi:hypothetical protein
MTDAANTFIAVNGHRLRALKLQVSASARGSLR